MVGRERWRLSDHKEGAHGREVELLSGGTQQEERARAQTRGETASWWITVAFQFHVEAAYSTVLMNTKYEDAPLDPRCVQQKSSRISNAPLHLHGTATENQETVSRKKFFAFYLTSNN